MIIKLIFLLHMGIEEYKLGIKSIILAPSNANVLNRQESTDKGLFESHMIR
jgi:hypothetical protein